MKPRKKRFVDGIEVLRPNVDYTLEDVLAGNVERWDHKLGEACRAAGLITVLKLRRNTFDENSETIDYPVPDRPLDFLKLSEADQRAAVKHLDLAKLSFGRVHDEDEIPYLQRVRQLLKAVAAERGAANAASQD